MSATHKRAVGLWVASKIAGLYVFADFLVNEKLKYPACELLEIMHDVEPLGCGYKTYTNMNGSTGYEEEEGRIFSKSIDYRLTFNSPDSTTMQGQEIIDNLLDEIETAILETRFNTGFPFFITDTIATPTVQYSVENIIIRPRQQISPDTSQKPFLFRGAVTLRFSFNQIVSRVVDPVIEVIELEHEIA